MSGERSWGGCSVFLQEVKTETNGCYDVTSMLAKEINRRLCGNWEVYSWKVCGRAGHDTRVCNRKENRCQIVFFEESTTIWSVRADYCDKCVEIFSKSLPPTDLYIQRHALMSRLVSDSKSIYSGCLCCYKRTRRVCHFNHPCQQCLKETRDFCRKWMIVRAVFGADIGRAIVGWMLCFFWFEDMKPIMSWAA
jgi:hypothetical protein